jgi:uncharacterized protein YodC (DUF2158 family)
MQFEIGAVVTLNSGGSDMTVCENRACDSMVLCCWHADNGKAQSEWYPSVALMSTESR